MLKMRQDDQNKRVYFKVNTITRDIRKGIRQAYYLIGRELKSYTNKKMQEPKSGRVYTVYRNGRKIKHTASAPGEMPWSRAPRTTGNLRKSLGFSVRGSSQLEFGAATPYAAALETTMNRSYLRRAITDKQKVAETFFYDQIGKALRSRNG
jgi:hypothetical protein